MSESVGAELQSCFACLSAVVYTSDALAAVCHDASLLSG